MKKYFLFFSLIVVLISCSKKEETPINSLSEMDKMFISGFNMSLEQVYVMNGENTIPYLDTPKDSAFKNNNFNMNISDFVSFDANKTEILTLISKNEIWNISKMETISKTIYVEHGYGDNYFITETKINNTYNTIDISNKKFAIKIKIDNIYNQRGHDNHSFNIYNIVDNEIYQSNLYMEVLTKNGNGLFDKERYVYLDTNPIFTLVRQITPPLTADKVKEEIANGNYELYLYDGKTTYKIGNNLYIPRFNNYVYIGTMNINGMIINYDSRYYRFKFRIV